MSCKHRECEQLFHDLEVRFAALQTEHVLLAAQFHTARDSTASAVAELDQTKSLLKTAQGAATVADANGRALQRKLKAALGESAELSELAGRRQAAVDRLQLEIKACAKSFSTTAARDRAAQEKVGTLQAEVDTAKLELGRLRQQKDLVERQNAWLQTELDARSADLLGVRKEASAAQLELQEVVDAQRERIHTLEGSAVAQAGQVKELQAEIDEQRRALKAIGDDATESAARTVKEIETQTRLAQLYKDSAEDAERKAMGLEQLVEALRTAARKGRERNSSSLRKHAEDAEKALAALKTDMMRKVSELEGQLLDVSRRQQPASDSPENGTEPSISAPTPGAIAGVGRVSPAVAAAAFLGEGKTMTDVYNELVGKDEALRQVNGEVHRLQAFMSQILLEIEQKAPLVAQQRKDYERALESHDDLSRRLEIALRSAGRLERELESCTRERDAHAIDKHEQDRLIADLNRQVQILLKENMKFGSKPRGVRGDRMLLSSSIGKSGSMARSRTASHRSTADDVISENLVTFKNIRELQVRNQQLLRVVRRLSDDREAATLARTVATDKIVEASLAAALKELQSMRCARIRQEEMVAAIVQQRDMYRSLLAQQDKRASAEIQRMPDVAPALQLPAQAVNSGDVADNRSKNAKARADGADDARNDVRVDYAGLLQTARTDFEEYRHEQRENHRLLRAELEQAQRDVSTQRAAATQARAEAKFQSGRNHELDGVLRDVRNQLGEARAKNSEQRTLLVRHQRHLQQSALDLQASREDVARRDATAATFTASKGLVDAECARLRQQVCVLVHHYASVLYYLHYMWYVYL